MFGSAAREGRQFEADRVPSGEHLPAGPIRDALEAVVVARDRRAAVLAAIREGVAQRRVIHAADQAAESEAIQSDRRVPQPKLLEHDAELEANCRRADALAAPVAAAMAALEDARAAHGAETAEEMTSTIDEHRRAAVLAREEAERREGKERALTALSRWCDGSPAWATPNEIKSGNPLYLNVDEGDAPTEPEAAPSSAACRPDPGAQRG